MPPTRANTLKKARKPAKAEEPTGQPTGKRTTGRQNGRAHSRPVAAASGPAVYMTSTEAQNGFGRVLDIVARGGTVVITRRNAAQAVVMSVERYHSLTGLNSPDLSLLTEEFDELVRRMQTPEVREAVSAAFWASPEELSRAAVAAAKREDA
jgi:antitoxin Phd